MSPLSRRIAALAVAALAAGVALLHRSASYDVAQVSLSNGRVSVVRSRASGLWQAAGYDERDFAMALGYVHALDRFTQMEVQRTVAAGLLADLVTGGDATGLTRPEAITARRLDLLLHELDFAGDSAASVDHIARTIVSAPGAEGPPVSGGEALEAYAEGVNQALNSAAMGYLLAPAGDGLLSRFVAFFRMLLRTPDLALARAGRIFGGRGSQALAAPWSSADSLMCVKLMSYLGLASLHQEFEKAIMLLLATPPPAQQRSSQDLERTRIAGLQQMFAPFFDDWTREVSPPTDHPDARTPLDMLRHIHFLRENSRASAPNASYPILANSADALSELKHLSGGAGLRASNNWAVAGSRSASGKAIMASDPHLEVNRLPGVWTEFKFSFLRDGAPKPSIAWPPAEADVAHSVFGITLPGVPLVAMGRINNWSQSFSYGFQDQCDYFVEEVRGGRVRRDGGQGPQPMHRREVRLKPDNASAFFFETDAGVIERADPFDPNPPADGLHLAVSWTNARLRASANIEVALRLLRTASMEEAIKDTSRFSISVNMLFADDERIAYAQGGAAPIRKPGTSGLVPLPAWEPGSLWQGMVPPEQLTRIEPANHGVLVTANDYWQREGGPLTVNLHMGDHRSRRIYELLGGREGSKKNAVEDMDDLQCDLVSTQARDYLQDTNLVAALRSVAADGGAGRASRAAAEILRWDLSYTSDSRGATAFEQLLASLGMEFIGERVLHDREHWESTLRKTSFGVDFFHYSDDFIRAQLPSMPAAELAAVVEVGLRGTAWDATADAPVAYETVHSMRMGNLLLGGLLPDALGFDEPNQALPGSRATVNQGQLFEDSTGRVHTFAPSWRMVAESGRKSVSSAIPGGPSGRPWSRFYKSELEGFKRCQAKEVNLALE